jgi:hypothetical protein
LKASGNGIIVASEDFDITLDIRLVDFDTDTLVRVGLVSDVTANPDTGGIYLEKLAADTSWFGVGRASSVQTRSAALSPAADGAFRRLRIRRLNTTTIGFAIGTFAEQVVASNVPTTAVLQPFIHIRNATGVNKRVDFDYMDFVVSSLGR